MAILTSRPSQHDSTVHTVELTPVLPTVEGPKNAHHICIQKNDIVVFEETYDVMGRNTANFEMANIAQMFRLAPQILSRKIAFQDPDSPDNEREEYVCLHNEINWLDVMVRGFRLRHEDRVWVRLYLRTDMQSKQTIDMVSLVSSRFICSPEAADQFGTELQEELKRASLARWNGGWPAPDDYPSPFNEVTDSLS